MERNGEMPEEVVLGFVKTYHGVKALVGAKGVVGVGEGKVVGGGGRTRMLDRGGASGDTLKEEGNSGGELLLVILGKVAVPDSSYFGKLVSRRRNGKRPSHGTEKGSENSQEV